MYENHVYQYISYLCIIFYINTNISMSDNVTFTMLKGENLQSKIKNSKLQNIKFGKTRYSTREFYKTQVTAYISLGLIK